MEDVSPCPLTKGALRRRALRIPVPSVWPFAERRRTASRRMWHFGTILREAAIGNRQVVWNGSQDVYIVRKEL